MKSYKIVELLGDGISAELSESVHRIAKSIPCKLDFVPFDLSDEARETKGFQIYDDAVKLMCENGVSLKYPTATTRESPNKVLRELCQFSVIHRPVSTIPGIKSNFTQTLDIDVVRVATGGTYDDAGQRVGKDTAVSLRVISRGPCRDAARFAFRLAMIRGTNVCSSSKWTIQRETDGFFEEIAGKVANDYPGISYRRELFDALLAGIVMHPERYGVIVCPNEYGDFLSDSACGLIGSVGLGDSSSYAFDDEGQITTAMFDPSGGTAPDIAGQGICNPTAALFAMRNMLRHLGEIETAAALRHAVLDSIAAGECTGDIGGSLNTREFTEIVAKRMEATLASA
jgi:isocitrate dehydrogenase (NAD+)